MAKRGIDHCRTKWQPTATYLSNTLKPHIFTIVPLDFASVATAVAEKEVEFILTNSSSYVELEDRYGVDCIATLINRMQCGDHKLFGGVIFTRMDRKDLLNIENLRSTNFMAVQETSLGGWRMAWREFKERGIDPHADFKSLSFGGTHDAVVFAVRDRQVDAGTVRTDTLERMSAEGKIDLSEFRILNINEAAGESVGFICSTRLYPEWPMARLPHTPHRLAGKVTQALLRLGHDHPAAKAANSGGWTYPLSYRQVHDCLKDLELGPYDPHARQDLSAIFQKYANWFFLMGFMFLGTGLGALYVMKLNTRLSEMNTDIAEEIDKRKKTEARLFESECNLRSALAAANEASNSKAEFLANMSHELRTPMNGIIGMTSILDKSDLTNEQSEFTSIIMKSAECLLGIINDILDYSHIEAGQSKLDTMDFDLYFLIEDAVNTISQTAEEKGLVFSYGVAEDVPAYLTGDARRIVKILRILMSNAVKFTHQGEVSLYVSLVQQEDTRCTLSIEVKDTGIGIAADHQEQIFNPFSQVDYSSTRKYGGTGLGLALAKHFAEMMGGSIEVESARMKGSRFSFTIALEKQSYMAPLITQKPFNITNNPRPQRIITRQSPAQAESDRPRVLVVEDNVVNQKVMLKILGKLEYPAKVVENGRKAVDELQKNPYDLVLMDIQMPEMNGYEATSAIRNPQTNCLDPQVTIIAVTANAMKTDRKACIDAGMDDYLPKPLNSKMLLEKIRQWYPESGSARRPRAAVAN